MLFDFHQKQNAKKPNSIHATYLISGTKRSVDDTNGTNGRSGEDVSMRSSPFMSSMPEPEDAEPEEETVKETTLLLVREEELGGRAIRTFDWMLDWSHVQVLGLSSLRKPLSTSTVWNRDRSRYDQDETQRDNG
jgi:hypothetical protein